MSEITLPLYANLDTRKLISRDGAEPDLPAFVYGDQVTCQLRLMEQVSDSEIGEVSRSVRSLRASLGQTMAPPAAGSFAIIVEGVASAMISLDANASIFEVALGSPLVVNALKVAPCCWVVETNVPSTDPEPALGEDVNRLDPVAFVRLTPYRQNGVWFFECRLIVSPLAFSGSFERILPDAPTVRQIRAGQAEDVDAVARNEIQAITIPKDFNGTYYLTWNYRSSSILGAQDDGVDEIDAALEGMWKTPAERFTVTLPVAYNVYVEFTGDLAEAPQPLMQVFVESFGEGVLTFTLDLETAELFEALRTAPTITVPLEIKLEVVPDGQDVSDPGIVGKKITVAQFDVTVNRSQLWDGLETAANIDWLRAPAAKDYIPFTPDQIITGIQNYSASFGNGALRDFSFPHNLEEEKAHVTIRENASGGRQLINGTDYLVHYVSENVIDIEIPADQPIPATNTLLVLISTAGPRSAFQAHTHTIGQIVGLEDRLQAIEQAVAELQDYLPGAGASDPDDTAAEGIEIPITPYTELMLYDGPDEPFGDDGLDLAILPPRSPWLPMACHDAVVASQTTSVLPAPARGSVWQNNSGAVLSLPGDGGVPTATIPVGGYFASDGRLFYAASRAGATNSFYPAAFERELFMLFVNEKQFRLNQTFELKFDLQFQLALANTRAQWVLVVEAGSAPADAVPAPVGLNLQNIIWQTNPLLQARMILTPENQTHPFGVRIKRLVAGIKADQFLYTAWENADAGAPAAANFALRGYLTQLDTENNVLDARGWLAAQMTPASSGDTESAAAGKGPVATIS